MGRLSRNAQHNGQYTNSKGQVKDIIVQYNDAKGGFVLKDRNTGKILIPTAYQTLAEMKNAGSVSPR